MSWWSDMVRTYSNVLCGYIMIYIYVGCTNTLHISINIHYIYAHIHFIPLIINVLTLSRIATIQYWSCNCVNRLCLMSYHPVWNGRPFVQGTLLFALSVPLLDWFKIKVRTRSCYLKKKSTSLTENRLLRFDQRTSDNMWQPDCLRFRWTLGD